MTQPHKSNISRINTRHLIHQILMEFESNLPRLDDIVNRIFLKYRLSDQDKRFIKNNTSGVVRHLRYLDWLADQMYNGRYKKLFLKIRVLLQSALFEIIFLDQIPERASVNEYVQLAKLICGLKQSKLVNAILRNYLRQADSLNPDQIEDEVERIGVRHSFPDWMVKRWLEVFGAAETPRLCASLNEVPRFELRVNKTKISVAEFEEKLTTNAIEFEVSKIFPEIFSVREIQKILTLNFVNSGFCSIQDESAFLPVQLLNPQAGQWVLDTCAAPGGKFTQILEAGQGLVNAVAVDADKARLKKVMENVRRLGLNNAFFIVADGGHLPFRIQFDRILIDAPCSGLGVIRKHPDIKWRREMKEIVEFASMQRKLLESAQTALLPGGSLVYSTCTINPLENQKIVAEFVNEKEDSIELQNPPEELSKFTSKSFIQTLPHVHNSDGSFAALFQKK